MQLSDLNDDILVHVFSYLYGKDALFVALTARRLHDMAIERVFAVVKCASSRELAQLHSHIIATSPSLRARHISDLEVDLPTAPAYPAHFKAEITRPLTELLMQTCNIRRLFLHGYFITRVDMEVCLVIAGALRAMSRLTELSMDHLHDAVLPLCASLPSSLCELSLGFVHPSLGFGHLWGEWRHSYPPLIRTLGSLPRLHTLGLYGFKPHKIYDHSAPMFPSLLNLTLHEVSLPAVDLVSLTPNLQRVSVIYQPHRPTWSDPPTEPWTEPPRPWPPVRRLEFNVMSTLSHFLDAISATADHLKITARTPPNRAADLISAFRILSPVSADLYLTVGEDPATFWPEFADSAQRLRCLRLSLTVKSSAKSSISWLDDFGVSFRTVPLVYLKVRPHINFDKKAFKKGVAGGSKRKSEALLHQERLLTHQVVSEFAASLPQRLADAIPTLCFFELGIPGEFPDPSAPYARGEDADSQSLVADRSVLDFLHDADADHISGIRNIFFSD
ncbi:hypothetical protein C8T65DRAFT_829216 [Cerioporus squamosus]|nr:hypothetical protein C8T65DRAFT_829216 [Cerioporus squamosus]